MYTILGLKISTGWEQTEKRGERGG